MQHDLKTWPESFEPIYDGRKLFEFRQDDRGYLVGDRLLLREYLPEKGEYTGRELGASVTHCLYGPAFGVPEGYVVMSIFPEQYAPLSLR